MYLKKTDLLKFLLGFACVLSIILMLALIIGKDYAGVRKNSTLTMPQEKSENPVVVKASNKNQLQIDGMSSDQIKQAEEISNIVRSQSRLCKKMEAIESTLSGLKANQDLTVSSEFNDNTDHDNDTLASEKEEEEILSQIRAELDMIQQTIESEAIDEEWSDSAIRTLHESIQENGAGGLDILNADCRSTLCRVDLTFDTTFPEESLSELDRFIPWKGEGFYQVDDINSGQAVLYIAREGYSLPRL